MLRALFLGLDTVAFAPLIVAAASADEDRAYQLCQLWAALNLRAFDVHVRVRRLAPLDPHASYVFMSNHQSHLDVLAAMHALPEFQLRWVAKKELADVPVFGWALRHAGHVIIDRSDRSQSVESLRAAAAQMRAAGSSVIIFPEGTRSTTPDALLPFKKGGFMLAIESGIPIVPIVVRGSRALLPPGSWRNEPGEIEVVVGAPIPVAGRPRDELMAGVRAFMLAELGLTEAAAPRPQAKEAV